MDEALGEHRTSAVQPVVVPAQPQTGFPSSDVMQRGSPAQGLTRPNDLLDLDPGGLNFTGELMHSLAGVLICVRVHIELGLGELHCQVSKGRKEISSFRQLC